MNDHPSQKKPPKGASWVNPQPYAYPIRQGGDYYESVKITHDPSNLALLRATEKFTHELEMVKNLLTAILNAVDMQGTAIDEVYDMLDCYIASAENDQS